MVIRTGIHEMLVKIENMKDPGRTASSEKKRKLEKKRNHQSKLLQKQSDLGLPCLARPFWQANSFHEKAIYRITVKTSPGQSVPELVKTYPKIGQNVPMVKNVGQNVPKMIFYCLFYEILGII